MATYKMPKQPIDDQKSIKWGLAALKSVGAGAGVVGGNLRIFDLINMDTYRAHRLLIKDGSAGVGLPVSVSLISSDYAYFRTSRPANFMDFDKKRSTVGTVDVVVYAWTTVEIFDDSKRLAEVKSSGWGLATPEASRAKGWTEIYFGDGRPVKTPEYRVPVPVPAPEERHAEFQVSEFDYGLVIRARGDVLFDPDRDLIHYRSSEVLTKIIHFINTKNEYKRMVIEGHTDNRMDHVPNYNMSLSQRRALAVLSYFKKAEWAFDKKWPMEAKWRGAAEPIEPNSLPGGGDNPRGREKNRRVEIYLYLR